MDDTKKHKNKKGRVVITVVLILVVIIALGFGYLWSKYNKLNQTKLEEQDIESNELTDAQTQLMEGSTQIAIFGVDNRSNGNYGSGNSDTIMIASIDHSNKSVRLVSVYRDTYLKIDEGYYGKANAAYAYYGAAGGLSMLNTNLDLNLDRYVTMDWYAVVKGIDLLGGVEIEISEAERQKINEYAPEVERVTGVSTSYLDESGLVHLDGVQAAAYMRIRKLAGDDYMRTQRQRMVIQALFKKVKQVDWHTINTVVDEVLPMIETNLTLKEIVSLAMDMGQYHIVSTTGFPFERSTMLLSGVGDCVIPINLETNVIQLHEYLFGVALENTSEEVQMISQRIINDTGLDIGESDIDTDTYTTNEM